uniref:DNA-directed RNA polymerase subunit beta'' n=1 Tax=Treubaria triappendiculata TaxID=1755147 RepID=A0A0S2LNG6_TRETR|nr:beta'' subunit of RNA polymerase [Treubaria triappendiculata]ALO62664.1 beta'' subunit of RNA polymerase [Treubaria triappendiculata]
MKMLYMFDKKTLPMFYKKKHFFNRLVIPSKKKKDSIQIYKSIQIKYNQRTTHNLFRPLSSPENLIIDKALLSKDIWSEKFWNYCFDKNRLKLFISWFLAKFGENKTLKLLEKFKYLGFHYATKAGISLSIDDLKIPPKKDMLIFEAEKQIMEIEAKYKKGSITGVEQFQMLIDTWHEVSETLKKEVVNYFEMTDFLNPVYMMAFSGARGNLSQVRQLAGMRGLMSDPQGRILDFPIQSNFREGLTLTEYIISSYGARKGIVDTALRTANAGYLTRRLVDVAQHVIISNLNCGTTRGIWLSDIKEGNKVIYSLQNRLLGRILATNIFHENILVGKKNQEISIDLAMTLSKIKQKIVVRSPLTCATKKTLCQLCYGWGLSQGNMVSIGEAVGIIAAQSIGEPGTQLTMRTFHTGGVFLGDTTDQIKAPYNGIIEYRNSIPGTLVRTPHGKIVFLTKNNGKFHVYNEGFEGETFEVNGEQKKIDLSFRTYKIPSFTLLFFKNKQKVKKNQILAQYSALFQQKTQRDDSEQDVSSQMEGEVYNGHLDIIETVDEIVLHQQQEKNYEKIRSNDLFDNSYMNEKIQDDTDISLEALNWGYLWILSGKIYQLPISSKFFPCSGDFIGYKNCLHRIQWVVPEKTALGFLNNKSISLNKNILFFNIKKILYHEFGYFLIHPVNKNKKIFSSFFQNATEPSLIINRKKDFLSKLVCSFYSPLEKFFLPFSLKDANSFQNFNQKNTYDWSPKFIYFLTWLPSKFYKKNTGLFYDIAIYSYDTKNFKTKKNIEIISYHFPTLTSFSVNTKKKSNIEKNSMLLKTHKNIFNKFVFEIFNLQNSDFAFLSFLKSINSVLFYFNNSKISFFLFHNFCSYWHKHILIKFAMNPNFCRSKEQLKMLPAQFIYTPEKLLKNKFHSPFLITNSLKKLLPNLFSLLNKKLFISREIQSEHVLWIPKYFYKIYSIESSFPFHHNFDFLKQFHFKKKSVFSMPSGITISFQDKNSIFYKLFFKYDFESFQPYDSSEYNKQLYQSNNLFIFSKLNRQGIVQPLVSNKKEWLKVNSISKQKISFYFYKLFKSSFSKKKIESKTCLFLNTHEHKNISLFLVKLPQNNVRYAEWYLDYLSSFTNRQLSKKFTRRYNKFISKGQTSIFAHYTRNKRIKNIMTYLVNTIFTDKKTIQHFKTLRSTNKKRFVSNINKSTRKTTLNNFRPYDYCSKDLQVSRDSLKSINPSNFSTFFFPYGNKTHTTSEINFDINKISTSYFYKYSDNVLQKRNLKSQNKGSLKLGHVRNPNKFFKSFNSYPNRKKKYILLNITQFLILKLLQKNKKQKISLFSYVSNYVNFQNDLYTTPKKKNILISSASTFQPFDIFIDKTNKKNKAIRDLYARHYSDKKNLQNFMKFFVKQNQNFFQINNKDLFAKIDNEFLQKISGQLIMDKEINKKQIFSKTKLPQNFSHNECKFFAKLNKYLLYFQNKKKNVNFQLKKDRFEKINNLGENAFSASSENELKFSMQCNYFTNIKKRNMVQYIENLFPEVARVNLDPSSNFKKEARNKNLKSYFSSLKAFSKAPFRILSIFKIIIQYSKNGKRGLKIIFTNNDLNLIKRKKNYKDFHSLSSHKKKIKNSEIKSINKKIRPIFQNNKTNFQNANEFNNCVNVLINYPWNWINISKFYLDISFSSTRWREQNLFSGLYSSVKQLHSVPFRPQFKNKVIQYLKKSVSPILIEILEKKENNNLFNAKDNNICFKKQNLLSSYSPDDLSSSEQNLSESNIILQKMQIESSYNRTKFPNFKANEIRYIYKNDKNVANFWLETKRLKIIQKNNVKKPKVRPTIQFQSLFLNVKKWNIEIHNGWFYVSQNWKNSLKYNKFLISSGQFNIDDLFFHQTVYFEFLPLSVEFIKVFQGKKQFVYENISWLKNYNGRFLPDTFFQKHQYSKISGLQIDQSNMHSNYTTDFQKPYKNAQSYSSNVNFLKSFWSTENYIPVLIQKTNEYCLNNSIQYENLLKPTSISNFQKNTSFLFFCFHSISLNKQKKTSPRISIFPSPHLNFEILKKLKIKNYEKGSYQSVITRKKISNRYVPNVNKEKKFRKKNLKTQRYPSKLVVAKRNLVLIHYIIKCLNKDFSSFKLPALSFISSQNDFIKLNLIKSFFSKIYTLKKDVSIERYFLLSALEQKTKKEKKIKSIFYAQNKIFQNIIAQNIVIQKFPSFFNLPFFSLSISQVLNSPFINFKNTTDINNETESILFETHKSKRNYFMSSRAGHLTNFNKNSLFSSHLSSEKFQKTIYLLTNQNQIINANNFAFTNYLSSYRGEILKQNYSKWYSFLKRDRILFLTNLDLISFYLDFDPFSVAKLTKDDIINAIRYQNFIGFFNGDFVRPTTKQLNSFVPNVDSQRSSSFNKIHLPETFSYKLEHVNKVLAEAIHSSSLLQKQLRSTYSPKFIKEYLQPSFQGPFDSKKIQTKKLLVKLFNKIYKISGFQFGYPLQKSFLYVGQFLNYGDKLLEKKGFHQNGQIIHVNLNKFTLRKGQQFFVSTQGIFRAKNGDFIGKNIAILTLPYQRLKTGDIIQGIPKVEQIFEARSTLEGRPFHESLPSLLSRLYVRYKLKLPFHQAVRESVYKIQQIIVNAIQKVYRSQGVSIADKHLEIIVRQMTSKVYIIYASHTNFFPGELIDLYLVEQINKILVKKIFYKPIILGITRASLNSTSFLSSASFQQVSKTLAKAAISRKKDLLTGIKENVLLGNLMPAGTGYFRLISSSN